jgi:hypothetical protein
MKITEEHKNFRAYGTLRAARNDSRLVGKRINQAKAKAEAIDK